MLPFRFVSTIALIVAPFAISSCVSASQKDDFRLIVLHTNDHHGHPLAFDQYPMKKVGGLPERFTHVKTVREREKNVILVDAGDWNTGRPESLFFNAEPDVVGYNEIGYDAVTIGNHEFDKSLAALESQIASLKPAVVIANILRKNGAPILGTKPYVVKNYGGKRVAVMGLMCAEPVAGLAPHIRGELKVRDDVEVAKELVPEIRKNADFVIALTHCGIFDDNNSGSRRLAAQVAGIDLIVDGHTHTQMTEPVMVANVVSGKRIPIVQAWQWGLEIGKTEIRSAAVGESVVSFSAIPVNLKNMKKNSTGAWTETPNGVQVVGDAVLRAKLQAYDDKVSVILGDKIGVAASDFDDSTLRTRESALGNLVADATFAYSKTYGADFVIQNGGSIKSKLFKGVITKKMPYEMLPYDNTVMIVSVAGAVVQQIFDFAASLPAVAPSFLQVAGIRVTLDKKQKRATEIKIGGEPLKADKTYRIATNSFLATGGDGYAMLKTASAQFDTSVFMRDLVIDYIKNSKGAISPKLDGRIAIVQ